MSTAWILEDIESLRSAAGIDDLELRTVIRTLRRGSCVRVTVLTMERSPQTVSLRIIRLKGDTFYGQVLRGSARPRLDTTSPGARLAFKAAHIHSVITPPVCVMSV